MRYKVTATVTETRVYHVEAKSPALASRLFDEGKYTLVDACEEDLTVERVEDANGKDVTEEFVLGA
jgi:hypothetical protein